MIDESQSDPAGPADLCPFAWQRYQRNRKWLATNAPHMLGWDQPNAWRSIVWKPLSNRSKDVQKNSKKARKNKSRTFSSPSLVAENLLLPEHQHLYTAAGASAHAKAQTRDFLENPIHLHNQVELDRAQIEFQEHRFSERICDIWDEVSDQLPELEDKKPHPDFRPPCLISIGLGLGRHLGLLLDQLSVSLLCVVEPDPLIFAAALFAVDLETLDQALRCRSGGLILSGPNLTEEFRSIHWKFTRCMGPVLSGSYCFQERTSPDAMQARLLFLNQVMANLANPPGFFDDERIFFENLVTNLSREPTRYMLRSAPTNHDCPVFIVGSGPSVAQTINVIREYRNDALILAAGSAMEFCLNHDLIPDYWVLLENIGYRLAFDQTIKLAKARGIRLKVLANLFTDPYILDDVGEIITCVRKDVSVAPMIDPELIQIGQVGPSVMNQGIEFAGLCGANRIFLFGSDGGSRVAHKLHAWNQSETRKASTWEGSGKAIRDHIFQALDKSYPASFGGTVHSNSKLRAITYAIEQQTISPFHESRTIFNCSNGIAIEGTIPLDPDTIGHHARRGHKETGIAAFQKLTESGERIMTSLRTELHDADEQKNLEYLIKAMQNAHQKWKSSRMTAADWMKLQFRTTLEFANEASISRNPLAISVVGGSLFIHARLAHQLDVTLGPKEAWPRVTKLLDHYVTVQLDAMLEEYSTALARFHDWSTRAHKSSERQEKASVDSTT